MPDLTLFTTPKPFVDPHISLIQRNAIRSWQALGQEVEVLLIGDEQGMAELAAELGIQHLRQVRCNEWGTPLISSIFELAAENGQGRLFGYVNADIILLPEVVKAALQVAAVFDRFVLVGQRWNLDVRKALEFEAAWPAELAAEVRSHGRRHPPAGSDYFIFPQGTYTALPDFAVGRAGWDNWMIQHARRQGIAVIDASADVMIVHQDHDYAHLPDGQAHYALAESDVNRALAGGKANMFTLFDADYRLVDGRVAVIPFSLARALRSLEIRLTPNEAVPGGVSWFLARRIKRFRRKLMKRRRLQQAQGGPK